MRRPCRRIRYRLHPARLLDDDVLSLFGVLSGEVCDQLDRSRAFVATGNLNLKDLLLARSGIVDEERPVVARLDFPTFRSLNSEDTIYSIVRIRDDEAVELHDLRLAGAHHSFVVEVERDDRRDLITSLQSRSLS